MDADVIGGFPFASPKCGACGEPLTVENAWMTDGCPCNCVLGTNSMNETRWRLLMELQQRQSNARDALAAELHAIEAAIDAAGGSKFSRNAEFISCMARELASLKSPNPAWLARAAEMEDRVIGGNYVPNDGKAIIPAGTAMYYCDRCDGCGWYEGGPTLRTDCEKCKGTGLLELK